MLLVALVGIICSVVFALWSWMKPRRHPSPPAYPGALPLIGHGHLFLGDAENLWKIEKIIYDYCLQKESVVELRLGPHFVYVISDPDDSLTVANTCLEKPYVYHFSKEMYGSGLITAHVPKWKPHRKLLNPAFNQQVINTFVEEYSIQAKSLVSQLASEVGQGPFDVLPYIIKNLLGTVCRTTLGIEADENSMTVKNYAYAAQGLYVVYLMRLMKIWLHLSCIFNWTSYKKKQDMFMKIMIDITTGVNIAYSQINSIMVLTDKEESMKRIYKNVIMKRRSELQTTNSLDETQEPENFKPLVDQILNLADKHNAFTDDEVREHLDTVIAAAYDTSASSLIFTMVLIGSHQDVQERIYKELQDVLGNKERDLDRHDLPKLVYMEAVIKESLRLYPPVPRIGRTSPSDVKLKNYTLPANCTYLISVYGLNRHSSWGADADQFKPERWLDPAKLPENPNTFASFSLGRRNCIAKAYGIMVIKTILAYVLQRYRIKSNIEKLEMRCDTLLRPKAGHDISLELRI